MSFQQRDQHTGAQLSAARRLRQARRDRDPLADVIDAEISIPESLPVPYRGLVPEPEVEIEEPEESDDAADPLPATEETARGGSSSINSEGSIEDGDVTPVGSDADPLPAAEEDEPSGPQLEISAVEAAATSGPYLPLNVSDETGDAQTMLLTTMGRVREGEVAIARWDLRSYPEMDEMVDEWAAAIAEGRQPQSPKRALAADAGQGALAVLVVLLRIIWALVRFSFRLLRWGWYHVTRNTVAGADGPPPPLLRSGDAPASTPGEAVPYRPTRDEELLIKAARSRGEDRAFFEAQLRLIAARVADPDAAPATDATDLDALVQTMSHAFGAYAATRPRQALAWEALSGDARIDALNGLMDPDPNPEPSLVLSGLELSRMIRVPDTHIWPSDVVVARSRFQPLRPVNPPDRVPDPLKPPAGIVPIGITGQHTDREQIIGMPARELDKHAVVVGRTGTGKSTLAIRMILGCAQAAYPVVVIDPHGDLADDVRDALVAHCPERIDDIVLVDAGDTDYPFAYNPLDIASPDQVQGAVRQGLALYATHGLTPAGQPRAVVFLEQALTALAEANVAAGLSGSPEVLTLLHVSRFFTDPEFRRLVVEHCTNSAVRQQFDPDTGPFEVASERVQQEYAAAILRASASFETSPASARVFAAANRLNMPELIRGRKIVLVKLGAFGAAQELGHSLAAMLPWAIVSSADEWGPRPHNPTAPGVRVFLDEAPAVLKHTDKLSEALAQLRKWDGGFVTIGQSLEQLDPQLQKDLLTNTATKIALRLSANATGGIENDLSAPGSPLTRHDLANLPAYVGYAELALAGGSSGAFTFATLPPLSRAGSRELARATDAVLARSRQLVATPRAEVDRRLSGSELVEGPSRRMRESLRERLERLEHRGSPAAAHQPTSDAASDWADLEPADE